MFVKPARAGSSLGISRVDDWADLDAAIAEARPVDPKVLVEAAVVGREIECGVLEFPDGRVRGVAAGRDPRAAGTSSTTSRPSTSTTRPVRHPGRPARRGRPRPSRSSRCRRSPRWTPGLARVDFFVTDDGRGHHQRGQHDARLHPDLDVPADVAAAGMSYPRAVVHADPDGAGPRHRAALSRAGSRLSARRQIRASAISRRRTQAVLCTTGSSRRCVPAMILETSLDARSRVVRDGDGDPDRAVGREVGGVRRCRQLQPGHPVDHAQRRGARQLAGVGMPQRSTIGGSPQAATPGTGGSMPACGRRRCRAGQWCRAAAAIRAAGSAASFGVRLRDDRATASGPAVGRAGADHRRQHRDHQR